MVRRPSFFVCAAVLLAGGAAFADPPVPEVQRRLREIESAITRGRIDATRVALEDQARNRPGDVMLRVYVAWCEMPSDAAWNALKNITAIYPDHVWARLGMAHVYVKWKMKDQAKAEYERTLKMNPRFYPALVGLGDLARLEGDHEAAAAKYRSALAIHDDAEAHAGLGFVLLEQKKPAEAKKALTRAAELWPDQPRVLQELVKLARADGDAGAAAKWLGAMSDLTPKDPEVLRQLADLHFESGDKEKAAALYERTLRLGGVGTEAWKRLAGIYAEAKNVEGEQRAREQLSALEKLVADHPLRLSELAEAAGDLEAAEAHMLEALDRAPTRADLHARLARLRVKRDNPREALDGYRAALVAPENPVEGLDVEAAALQSMFKLPKKPVKGSIDQIHGRVSANLNAFYAERAKVKPDLGGIVKIRVRVDAAGVVQGADVIEDTVGDPYLVGHAYFALKDAVFPKKKREPVFEFELGRRAPPKGK